jgi:hypothetical protein
MKKTLFIGIAAVVSFGLLLGAGCAQKAGSASEAIQKSQSYQTVTEKADYLISQAKAFYNSKEFQSAIDTARYVLNTLDSDSQQAKELIEKATAQLKAAAEKAMGDVSNKLLGK